MAGTVKGVVDCAINTGNAANSNRALFVNLYNYFQAQVTEGQAALHASFFGNGGALGFDFHDGTNPAGENAWACFQMLASSSPTRTIDYYVLIQWCDAEAIGTGGGAPAAFTTGSDGVGLMVAFTESGVSPWGGTTNADGTDTKGTPVWIDNGSTLHVMTQANETGAHSTNKEDLNVIIDTSTNPMYIHIVGDADCTFIYVDTQQDTDVDGAMWFGAFEPLTGLTIAAPIFFAHLSGTLTPTPANIFDNTGNYDGQMSGFDVTDGIQDFSIGGNIDGVGAIYAQPASHGAFVNYIDYPMYIIQRTGSSNSGLIGNIPTQVCSFIYNVPANTANAALDRAYVPIVAAQASLKYSIPWGGSNPPTTNGGHVGISI